MTMPTLDKTYQFARSAGAGGAATINKYLTNSGAQLADNRTALLQIVNDLISFTSNPWTVIGSSNSSASGMDAVNRWSAITNLVFATSSGTIHSWIVLQQAGINAKTQICIDLISPSATANSTGFYIDVILSPSAGFGTANGGSTNGSTSTRPTATDEIRVITSSAAHFLRGDSGGLSDYITNVIQSTDGQVTRVFIRVPGSRWSAYFCVEKPKSPLSGWTSPVVARWLTDSSLDVTTYANWNYPSTGSLYTRAISTTVPLFVTAEGYSGGPCGNNLITRNEISSEWEMYQMGLVSDTAGWRGRHGKLFDLYWISQIHRAGTYFPSDGSRAWTAIGHWAMPWNGSIITVS